MTRSGCRGVVCENARMQPETRYALSGDIHIAYQLVGDGPFDLVFVPGFVTHMELQWRLPGFESFLTDLGSFSRLIRFDKRGTGMSDPVSGGANLETRMDDVRAVMDAVGSRASRVLRPVGGSGDEHPVRRNLPRPDRGTGSPELLATNAVGTRLPVGSKRSRVSAPSRAGARGLRPGPRPARQSARLGCGTTTRSRRSSTTCARGKPRDARGALPDEQGDRRP